MSITGYYRLKVEEIMDNLGVNNFEVISVCTSDYVKIMEVEALLHN